jgi:hypothetical protein
MSRREAIRDPDRMWVAVMVGDVVRDGHRRCWSVTRVAHEGRGVWVEISDGANTRAMHVVDAGSLVELREGPGWGMAALGEGAMSWAATVAAEVLGAAPI